jgi:CheY-like chemotaxis protein
MANILIIDDDENMCDLLRTMLRLDRHFVNIAQDGEQALKIYNNQKPDLIITDIIMPNKSGIEFMIELNHQGNNVPIIAMSGGRRAVTSEFNLQSAEFLGAKAILSKPFNNAQLKEAIQKALS